MLTIIYLIMSLLWLVAIIWAGSVGEIDLEINSGFDGAAAVLVIVSTALLWPVMVIGGLVWALIEYVKEEDEE